MVLGLPRSEVMAGCCLEAPLPLNMGYLGYGGGIYIVMGW